MSTLTTMLLVTSTATAFLLIMPLCSTLRRASVGTKGDHFGIYIPKMSTRSATIIALKLVIKNVHPVDYAF